MPARSDNPRTQIPVSVSAPIELMWLIHWSGATHDHHGAMGGMEEYRRVFGPDLHKLWDDRAPQVSTEMLVLAHRSGAMLDADLDRFFSRLETTINEPAPLPSLRSESVEERELMRQRLERLRDDRALRRRYVDLLKRLWSAAEAEWLSTGRAAVITEAEKWSKALETAIPYRQLLQTQHLWPPRPETDVFADAAAAEGNMVMTPAWFGGQIHVLEFDGKVYVGRGIRHEGPTLKQMAADIAGNAKTLSDPTRVAILLLLARESASVTEIARHFQLSQPTVSAHVQVLREAGLLEEKTMGRSALLSASQDGVRRLFAGAEETLVRAFRP